MCAEHLYLHGVIYILMIYIHSCAFCLHTLPVVCMFDIIVRPILYIDCFTALLKSDSGIGSQNICLFLWEGTYYLSLVLLLFWKCIFSSTDALLLSMLSVCPHPLGDMCMFPFCRNKVRGLA